MTAAPSLKAAAPEGILVRAKLSDVFADYSWNARSKTDLERVIPADGSVAGYNPETEGTGMGGFRGTKTEPGLVELLVLQGQRTPCDARPNPARAPNPNAPKYDITAGFRRHYALSLIAKNGVHHQDFHPIIADPTWDAREPTILLLVKDQSDREAKERNLVENTGREGLSTPDLAHGVAELRRLITEENRGREPTNDDVARRIGRTGKHIGNLLRIMRLPESITKHWRDGGEAYIAGHRVVCVGSLPLNMMVELAGMQSGTDYETAYVKMVMGSRDETTGEKKGADDRRFEKAMKVAAELGELVAYLAHEGIDPGNMKPDDWGKIVEELVDYEDASGDQLDLLARRLSTSYEREREVLSSPEDGGGDEETQQRQRDQRDGGR
jgi:hypothetical protein